MPVGAPADALPTGWEQGLLRCASVAAVGSSPTPESSCLLLPAQMPPASRSLGHLTAMLGGLLIPSDKVGHGRWKTNLGAEGWLSWSGDWEVGSAMAVSSTEL